MATCLYPKAGHFRPFLPLVDRHLPDFPEGREKYQSQSGSQLLFSYKSTLMKVTRRQSSNEKRLRHRQLPICEICILAGGRSQRMRRDKTRLRVGQQTMLEHVRSLAEASGLTVRVIRRDSLPSCGPLSGIYTALASTRAEWTLFLAADMPFLSTGLLLHLTRQRTASSRACVTAHLAPGSASAAVRKAGRAALFVCKRGRIGFPFLLPRVILPVIAQQIGRRRFSLQALARRLQCKKVNLPARLSSQLRNINTPQELAEARAAWRSAPVLERTS